jgi:hypothetical protein
MLVHVSTIVNMVRGIITKTGNSYAIRLPKRYIDDNNLKLGDHVDVEEPLVKQRQALDALLGHGKKHGPLKGISDPVAWQREQRAWEDQRKKRDE